MSKMETLVLNVYMRGRGKGETNKNISNANSKRALWHGVNSHLIVLGLTKWIAIDKMSLKETPLQWNMSLL